MATVILEDAGRNEIAVIKVIRELTKLGLKEAKDLADGVPQTVLTGVDAATASAAAKALQAEGARVRLDQGAGPTTADVWDDTAIAQLSATVGAAGLDVVLLDAGRNKIAVIKEIRQWTGLGLKEAKDLADTPGQVVLAAQPLPKAEAARAALTAAGARVALRGK